MKKEYTVVLNGELLGYYDSKNEIEEVIKNHLNQNEDLAPTLAVQGLDVYLNSHGEVRPCEIQIWRYRTLYFEQFLIIEGSL